MGNDDDTACGSHTGAHPEPVRDRPATAVTSPDIGPLLREQLIAALPDGATIDRERFADELLDVARRAGTAMRDARLHATTIR